MLKSFARCVALALGAAFSVAGPAAEAALMVDFNDAHLAGGEWETIVAPDHDTPITLSNGTTLLFGRSSTGTEWFNSSLVQATDSTDYAGTAYEDVASDYFWASATTKSFVLGNLNPAVAYSLDLISARATSGARISTITANGLAADAEPHDGVEFDAFVDGWSSGTVLHWSSLTPNSAGEITLTFAPSTSSHSYFVNGFVLVPEPASVALLGVGGFLLVTRRRRQA